MHENQMCMYTKMWLFYRDIKEGAGLERATPRPHRYGDITVTYIRRAKIPSHKYSKHQYKQKSESK